SVSADAVYSAHRTVPPAATDEAPRMPGDPNRPAWKGAAAGPTSRGPRYAWKPQDQPASVGLWKRRLKIAGLTLGGVACVGLLGASDADGPDGPYLDPGDGHAPVRLKELLTLLAGGRLAAKHKVLLLDPARGDPDPARGVLANDFARGLLALEPEIKKDKNLVLICGS